MIGHVPELYNPANSGTRVNSYPNSYYTTSSVGAEPSIRGNILYIPLNAWFNLNSQMAFPLISLQYNELHINEWLITSRMAVKYDGGTKNKPKWKEYKLTGKIFL